MTQATKTGGKLIVDALLSHGADAVFCVPGESHLEVLDGLHDVADRVKLITCRHEHGAAFMAESYAKLTGKPGVCLVTRGPGACNASIGVHTAFQDSTPMLLLIGQVARPHIGREAFQEVDFERMFAPLAKAAEQVNDAGQAPEIIARAYRTMVSDRPGSVVLALPEDMQREASDAAGEGPFQAIHASPGASDMEQLRKLLDNSERPLMMVGGGGWNDNARRRILDFAETNGLPACASFRCHDIIDNRHSCYVGEVAISPDPALVARVKDCDLLLVVGARLGEITTQGYTLIDLPTSKQTLVHVYPGADELGRVFQPSVAIHSAVSAFAAAAADMEPVEWGHRARWCEEARRDYLENKKPPSVNGPLDMGRVMVELDALLPDDSVVSVDAGNFSGWPQRFLTFGPSRRLLGATSGAMGYSVPAAVAAKIARPESTVVGMAGDGGFAMTGQELATAALYGATPLILVANNRMYGTIRMHQERRHPGRVIGTALSDIDFAGLAPAYGAHGERVERTEDFAPAYQRALASGKPALIELITDPEIINTRTTLSATREAALKKS